MKNISPLQWIGFWNIIIVICAINLAWSPTASEASLMPLIIIVGTLFNTYFLNKAMKQSKKV